MALPEPVIRWAPALLGGVAVGGGCGLVTRVLAPEASTPERASAAVAIAIGVGAALAPALPGRSVVRCVRAGLGGALGGLVATATAGALSLGAAGVIGGVAALSVGIAELALAMRAGPGTARLCGALVPLALVAAVFVADPFIEWRGAGPRSSAVARWVYRVNPLASALSLERGTGVDWQTRPWMYDGGGAGGLSVIGQYYPSRPSSPWGWSGWALSAGLALALVFGRARAVAPQA